MKIFKYLIFRFGFSLRFSKKKYDLLTKTQFESVIDVKIIHVKLSIRNLSSVGAKKDNNFDLNISICYKDIC